LLQEAYKGVVWCSTRLQSCRFYNFRHSGMAISLHYLKSVWNAHSVFLFGHFFSGQRECRESCEVDRQDQWVHLCWRGIQCSWIQQDCSSPCWLGLLQISLLLLMFIVLDAVLWHGYCYSCLIVLSISVSDLPCLYH
jgi:hypothetical protein